MEELTEVQSEALLGTEWLVKVDGGSSTPYLLFLEDFDRDSLLNQLGTTGPSQKFLATEGDIIFIATDTKSVWVEVMNLKQFAHRWRKCNPAYDLDLPVPASEMAESRKANLAMVSRLHSLAGVQDIAFEVVESYSADLAVEFTHEIFVWRWETYLVGRKRAADFLSRHLIIPLISLTHLSFSSADPVSELAETDLEAAVDKSGRIARRSLDTHVKHAISKPRVATSLRRVSAILNSKNLQPIQLDIDPPDPVPAPLPLAKAPGRPLLPPRNPSPPVPSSVEPTAIEVESATESESDVPLEPVNTLRGKVPATPTTAPPSRLSPPSPESPPRLPQALSSRGSSQPQASHRPTPSSAAHPPSDDDEFSPPPRPTKKSKVAISSTDEDSETEGKPAKAAPPAGGKRGVRQPLKRGGKRF